MRITDKQLLLQWRRFLKNIHGEQGNAPGQFQIDYNRVYGGWQVVRKIDSGGETEVFGMTRHRTREMYEMLNFANRILEFLAITAPRVTVEAAKAQTLVAIDLDRSGTPDAGIDYIINDNLKTIVAMGL